MTRQIDGQGFAGAAQPGDVVSVLWCWAREVLSRPKLERLMRYTRRYIAIAKETI